MAKYTTLKIEKNKSFKILEYVLKNKKSLSVERQVKDFMTDMDKKFKVSKLAMVLVVEKK